MILEVGDVLIDVSDGAISPTMRKKFERGYYEIAETELIDRRIRDDHPVIDLGAGVGYTACLIDRVTAESTPTIAVEPNEALISVIERTRSLNQCDFTISHSAYDSSDESVRFMLAEDFWSSSQYNRDDTPQEKVIVPGASLEDILEEHHLERPVQVVADIEGGEHDLIVNECGLLQEAVSVFVCEYHSFTEHPAEYYENIMTESGFELIETLKDVYVFQATP